MTATAHALVGGAIAASVANPAIGLPLAALSHPLCDMIPHWDFGLGWKKKPKETLFFQSVGDLLVGILITYFIFRSVTALPYLTAAIFLSVSWDILMMPYLLFSSKLQPFYLFYKVQSSLNNNIKLPWGILTQVGTVLGIVLLLKIFHFQ